MHGGRRASFGFNLFLSFSKAKKNIERKCHMRRDVYDEQGQREDDTCTLREKREVEAEK